MKTLDEFYASPSVDVLAGLYDAINAMDLSHMPMLTRGEKLILRSTERKDFFSEKFGVTSPRNTTDSDHAAFVGGPGSSHEYHDNGGPTVHQSKFDLVERAASPFVRRHSPTRSDRSTSVSSGRSSPLNGEEWKDHEVDDDDTTGASSSRSAMETETDDGFTLVDSSGSTPRPPSRSGGGTMSKTAFDQHSLSSKTTQSTRHRRQGSSNTMAPSTASDPDSHQAQGRWEMDTHYYPSSIIWRKFDETSAETVLAKIDVNIPISTFSGEVGDVSQVVERTGFLFNY